MNIAICDNEEMFVKNISGLLEEYLNENKLQYSIDMYSSGSELIGLKDKIVNYDIVFLDINMTGIDNIKVAEWIRMYSDRVIIISITSMSDYNIQGYKYDVFRCVLKDSMDLKGSIYECMNAVLYKLNYINSDKRIISCDSGSKEVDVSKIIYIESSGHKVTYHIHGKEFGDYVVKSKLDDIENELKEYKYLLRVHQSYMAKYQSDNNKSLITEKDNITPLVIEKDIANMGNLLLDNDNLKSKKNGSENMAYVGYSYRNEYKTGIQFNYYEENEKSSCEIAGYLKKGASWPLKGKLFGGVSDIDSYNLDNTIVVITPNYEYFDNIGGMPDTPYYIVDDEAVADKLKMDIVEWAAERNLGVSVINEAEEIANEKELRNITADSSFSAEVLLFLLALISMSSVAIVSCLLNRQHMGIMVACGVSKRSIMAINYMENVFVVLIPEIIIWLICQKNIFGKVFMNNISELDMIKYGDWFSHCVAVPIMYLAELVIVTVIAGIVPMFIISRMKVAEVIKPVD